MIVQLEDVSVRIKDITVLHELSAVIDAPVTAIVGPNGAGKSTLLNTLAGMIAPSTGTVRLDGKLAPRGRPDLMVASGVSLVPEGRRVFGDLTVKENLLVGGIKRSPSIRERDLDPLYAQFPELERLKDRKAGSLSGGEQQMVAIARSLASKPSLMLLDEPSLGLAPIRVAEIFRGLAAISRDGIRIVLVEQNVHAALKIADHVFQLSRGRIVRQGPVSDFEQITTLQAFTE